MAKESIEKKQAVFRSRRGLLELDLILVPFVESWFDSMSCCDQKRYLELLDFDDFELIDWLKSSAACPQKFESLIDFIRNPS